MIANPTRLIMTLMKKKDTNITTQHLFPRSLLLSTKKGSCLSLYQTLSVRARLGPSGLPTLQRPKAIAFGEWVDVVDTFQVGWNGPTYSRCFPEKIGGVPLWIIHFDWGFHEKNHPFWGCFPLFLENTHLDLFRIPIHRESRLIQFNGHGPHWDLDIWYQCKYHFGEFETHSQNLPTGSVDLAVGTCCSGKTLWSSKSPFG